MNSNAMNTTARIESVSGEIATRSVREALNNLFLEAGVDVTRFTQNLVNERIHAKEVYNFYSTEGIKLINVIQSAFSWKDTYEGSSYWLEMNLRFNDTIQKEYPLLVNVNIDYTLPDRIQEIYNDREKQQQRLEVTFGSTDAVLFDERQV